MARRVAEPLLYKKRFGFGRYNSLMAAAAATPAVPMMFYADLLVPFAEAANIRARDAAGTVRKRIVTSLVFADAERLYRELFPTDAVDWAGARAYLAEATLSTSEWVQLVGGLLHFLREPPTRPAVAELVAAASAGMRASAVGADLTPLESLQLCFARAGFVPTWDTLCKSLLLTNLADVDAGTALAQLLATPEAAKRSAGAVVDAVLKHLPAYKHSRDEYTHAFLRVLSHDHCHVAAHLVIRSIKAREEARERTRQSARALFSGSQKPSLTRLLLERGGDANYYEDDGADTFRRFCVDARLPASAAPATLQAVYYFACLAPDVRVEAFRLFFPEQQHERLLNDAVVVVRPEPAPLRAFVGGAQHFGAPCTALRLFRQHCGTACSSWTAALRLYLAAYAHPSVARDLWQHALAATLAAQQQHALGAGDLGAAFVREHPRCAVADIVPLLLLGQSAPPAAP